MISASQSKSFILLDTESKDLGSPNGQLSLIQLGVGTTTYLVDIVKFPSAIRMLKSYLESPRLRKYVWDGRSDYSEVRHGHGITLNGVVDLQLVHIHLTRPPSNVHRLKHDRCRPRARSASGKSAFDDSIK